MRLVAAKCDVLKPCVCVYVFVFMFRLRFHVNSTSFFLFLLDLQNKMRIKRVLIAIFQFLVLHQRFSVD